MGRVRFSSLSRCLTVCPAVETCGGPNVLSLMFNPNPSPVTLSSIAAVPSPTSGPSASATSGPAASTTNGDWTAAGCSQDGSSRALTGYSFASSSMTPALCQNACADRGFSVAGLEYGSECYCECFVRKTIMQCDVTDSVPFPRHRRCDFLLQQPWWPDSRCSVLHVLFGRLFVDMWWAVGT